MIRIRKPTLDRLVLGLLLVFALCGRAEGQRAETRAPDPTPFLLGGIQLNEDDHERWAAALLQAGMNAVQVTVYAQQGAWNGPELWFEEEEPAVLAEIRAARRNGLEVVLILRVALNHSYPENRFLWHGLVWPESEPELDEWFRRYSSFVSKWARVAEEEGVAVLGIGSEMNSLAATLPVEEVPELAEYYLDDAKQLELRALVGRHRHLFGDEDLAAIGAGDFASVDEFLIERNRSERRWARSYTFAGDENPVRRINHRRARLERRWQELIAAVRSVYSGRLTFAANFDNYHEVGFWDALDLLGINAYFPLRATLDQPLTLDRLTTAWSEIFAEVEKFRKLRQLSLPVVFTELGYTQRSGVTVAPWSQQGLVPLWDDAGDSVLVWSKRPDDPSERALAVEALYAAWQRDRFPLAGVLYWKLSSRLDLGRYEPFMLYMGPDSADPLFEAFRPYRRKTLPFTPRRPAGYEAYGQLERAIRGGDLESLSAYAGGWLRAPVPKGALPPLHQAARLGRKDAAEALVRGGVEKGARDASGYLALHWSCYQESPELVPLLVPETSVSWADDSGETPLAKCARLDNIEVMRALLEERPRAPSATNEDLQTALRLAADQASAELVELLIRSGAEPDRSDPSGLTALHVAARRGNPEILERLLAASDGAARDRFGQRPIDYAAYYGQEGCFDLLWKAEAKAAGRPDRQTLLHYAAHGGNQAIVAKLIEAGHEVNRPDDQGRTPLHFAVTKTHRAATRLLLEHGAEIDRRDQRGRSALHLAAESKDAELLRSLLAQSLTLDATDTTGNTALHYAAGWGRVENVRLLLEAGAGVVRKNDLGQTALDSAEVSGRQRVVLLLRRAEEGVANSPG